MRILEIEPRQIYRSHRSASYIQLASYRFCRCMYVEYSTYMYLGLDLPKQSTEWWPRPTPTNPNPKLPRRMASTAVTTNHSARLISPAFAYRTGTQPTILQPEIYTPPSMRGCRIHSTRVGLGGPVQRASSPAEVVSSHSPGRGFNAKERRLSLQAPSPASPPPKRVFPPKPKPIRARARGGDICPPTGVQLPPTLSNTITQ